MNKSVRQWLRTFLWVILLAPFLSSRAADCPNPNVIIKTRSLAPADPSRCCFVDVQNLGSEPVQRVTFYSAELSDPLRGLTLTLPPYAVNVMIGSGHEAPVKVSVPIPVFAGVYTGRLHAAIADQEFDIPLTLSVRGPNFPMAAALGVELPALLFLATSFGGFWLATVLEDWFGLGSLYRGQLILNLQQSERHLSRILSAAEQSLFKDKNPSLHRIIESTEGTLRGLRRIIDAALDIPERRLLESAVQFSVIVARSKVLWDGIEIVLMTGDAQLRNETLSSLLEVSQSLEPTVYRDHVQQKLEAGLAQSGTAAAELAPPIMPHDLGKRIKSMARLYRAAVWTFVFLLCVNGFYIGHSAFGSFMDYAATFLFTVALAQTGTQFLARFRSSFTRAK